MKEVIAAIVFIIANLWLYSMRATKHKGKVLAVIAMIISGAFFLLPKWPEPAPPVVLDFTDPHIGSVDPQGLQLRFGEVGEINQLDNSVTIQAIIKPNLTNKMTIGQNYTNVEYLIKKNGFNTCDGIRYWAVVEDGDTTIKVIQFDLSKDIIDMIYSEKLFGSQIPDYATDLWIAPALLRE